MLYLFGTGSYDGQRKALKVGYTGSQDKRETDYGIHNPLGKFLVWREGDRKLEAKLHLRLQDYREDFLDEWFFDEDDVISIFSQSEEEIDKWLKENAATVFSPLPPPGSLKREIYEEVTGNIIVPIDKWMGE